MGRRKSNRYRVKTSGLKIEQSLPLDWTLQSDSEIISKILKINGFSSVLESFEDGTREIELIRIREHKE